MMIKKLIGKLKHSVNGIHWPSKREVVSDTLFTVSVATVLSLMIVGWAYLIDCVVNWAVSLF